MTGPGNDIIALKTIDISRTRSARFYSKILSPAELQLYTSQHHTLAFEQFVWLLWSVKESVYKCLQRQHPELVFSPVRIIVNRMIAPEQSFTSAFAGQLQSTGFTDACCFCSEIIFNSVRLHARSIIYGDECIHTVAQAGPDFNRISWGIKQIDSSEPDRQSAEVRAFLSARLKQAYPGRQITIEKDMNGRPGIMLDGTTVKLPISLSHHEGYVAYAINTFCHFDQREKSCICD
jgi:phosphopantetheine--protein transferase-like protein